MQRLSLYVARYGMSLIFANVLAEQLGLPIPAMPTLIVAGALVVEKDLRAVHVLAVSVARVSSPTRSGSRSDAASASGS